jgi:alpha-beta hydrolase superfamily lysophospholipase
MVLNGFDDRLIYGLIEFKERLVKPTAKEVSYVLIPSVSDSNKVLFALHGWRGSTSHLTRLADRFRQDYTVVLLSYPDSILSSDPKETIRCFGRITDKVKSLVDRFEKHGKHEYYVFGVSLGAYLSVYLSNRVPVFRSLVLSLPGASLARIVWESIATQDIKQDLIDRKYNYDRLKNEWRDIELNGIAARRIPVLMFMSKDDMLVDYGNQVDLLKLLRSKGSSVKSVLYKNLGHYLSALKSMGDTGTIQRFLEGGKDGKHKR